MSEAQKRDEGEILKSYSCQVGNHRYTIDLANFLGVAFRVFVMNGTTTKASVSCNELRDAYLVVDSLMRSPENIEKFYLTNPNRAILFDDAKDRLGPFGSIDEVCEKYSKDMQECESKLEPPW